MTTLAGGIAVVDETECGEQEGTRRYRTPISRSSGAREIAQSVSIYGRGRAPARRNRSAEEVLYVVSGRGTCHIDGFPYALAPGTGVYLPPGALHQIENEGSEPLVVCGVCCPEETGRATEVLEVPAGRKDRPLLTVSEESAESIPAGDRSFKLLVDGRVGCRRVTQFVGLIPPGRAPVHRHAYEEAIYILQGEGRVWSDGASTPFRRGSSIYLPPGVAHSLENTANVPVRLLGVFYPSGSPAARYPD